MQLLLLLCCAFCATYGLVSHKQFVLAEMDAEVVEHIQEEELLYIPKTNTGCYAQRYPALLDFYCDGNPANCREQELMLHFQRFGKLENFLFDCPLDSSPGKAADALCYAQRYPDMQLTFCPNGMSSCNKAQLLLHYRDHGQAEHRVWECPRETSPAKPVGNSMHFVKAMDTQVLIYETDPVHPSARQLQLQFLDEGINATVFGLGTVFTGFGSKYSAVKPYLQAMDRSALAVILDARDILLNVHNRSARGTASILQGFTQSYRALTWDKPGAVVMSAEAQCCVSALTHTKPGDYFDVFGARKQRACHSGKEDCEWVGDSLALPWMSFMQELGMKITGMYVEDPYLNAGAMAGHPQDLLRLITNADIQTEEDDQAVFTDYLFHNPKSIVLDYAQEMFGNNKWTEGVDGCVFKEKFERESLVHQTTGTTPLTLHSPGKFFWCHDKLANLLEMGNDVKDDSDVASNSSANFLQMGDPSNYGGHGRPSNYGGGVWDWDWDGPPTSDDYTAHAYAMATAHAGKWKNVEEVSQASARVMIIKGSSAVATAEARVG